MATTQGNLAGLSRFIVHTPSWRTSMGVALMLAAVVGMVTFNSQFILEDAWRGLFYIGVPTLVASVVTAPLDRIFGGNLTSNQAALLALISELVVVGLLTVASSIALVTRLGDAFAFDVLLVALAVIFALRLLVILIISQHRLLVASIPASVQTVVAVILLAMYSGTTRFFLENPFLRDLFVRSSGAPPELLLFQLFDLRLLVVTCILYAVGTKLFLTVLDWPWRSGLGVSAVDFLQGFVGYLVDGSHELETFFESIGEDAVAPVTVCSIRTLDGTEKARFVMPMLHPGPMGEIGGGNLPERIARDTDGLAFPPHATAGHDFNLVSTHELDPVLSATRSALSQIEYHRNATPSRRITNGEATLTGQAIGTDALMINTFAPSHADDIEYAVGLSATTEARLSGLNTVLLADAHNCSNGIGVDATAQVAPGTKRSFELINGARQLGEQLMTANHAPLQCGVAWDRTRWDADDGIGPLGVRVAVFEVANQQTAYVLIDGNNMIPGLREQIITAVDTVDRIEVMTTDTHIVNRVNADNRVGGSLPAESLVALIKTLVDRARDDLEPVEAGMARESAEVTVFGNDRTETLASTANAVISMGGVLGTLLLLSVLALTIVLFIITSG